MYFFVGRCGHASSRKISLAKMVWKVQKGVNCRFSTHFLTFFSVSQTCEGFRKKWVNFYHMVYRAIYVFFCRPLRARQLEKNQFFQKSALFAPKVFTLWGEALFHFFLPILVVFWVFQLGRGYTKDLIWVPTVLARRTRDDQLENMFYTHPKIGDLA